MSFSIDLPCIDVCLSQKDFERTRKRLKLAPMPWLAAGKDGCCIPITNSDNDLGFILCLTPHKQAGKDYIQLVGLIVHECTHIWQELCEHYGEANPGYETEAYTIQSLTQSILYTYDRELKRQKAKK